MNSMSPSRRISFQVNLLRSLTQEYSFVMIVYAFLITLYANIKAFIEPSKAGELPGVISDKLPAKFWYKGSDSNCSVVAVIKAVQARYGDNIFKKINIDISGNYHIILKDDTELEITRDELNKIKKKSHFEGPESKSKDNAWLAYAAMVKNSLLRKEFSDFSSALKYFNSGSYPEHCAEMLGYRSYTMNTDPMRGLTDIVIAYNKHHAICINHGFIEGYREKLLFAGHDTMGKFLDKAIVIV